MSANDEWAAMVAEVEHTDNCASRRSIGASHPHLAAYFERCNCDRDVCLGRKIAAVEQMAFKAGMRFQRCGGEQPRGFAPTRGERLAAFWEAK